MAGRPTKYSQDLADAICKLVALGNTFTAAALIVGIDRNTLAAWRGKYPAFSRALDQAEAKAERDFVNDLVFASRKGDWTAAKFWLTHRRGDDWRPPAERQEVSGPAGAPLTVKVLRDVTMDDI